MSEAFLRLIPVRPQPLSLEVPNFRLRADEVVADGLHRVTSDQLKYARRALEHSPVDIGVHEARKAIKRVRAVLRLAQSFVGDGVYRQDNQELRDMGRKLGPARDAAVLRQTFAALTAQSDTELGAGAFEHLRQHLANRQRALESEIDARADGLGFLDPTSSWIPSTVVHDPNRPAIPDNFDAIAVGIRAVYRGGRKRMEDALAHPGISAFHLWRNRARYLRYQIALISDSSTYLASDLAPDLAQLAVGLGTEHDLAVMSELVRAKPDLIQNDVSRRVLLSLLGQRRLDLKAALEPIGKRIYADTPEQFVDSLEAGWEKWKAGSG